MIKYYSELDNPDKFYLPLVRYKSFVHNFTPPANFWLKYTFLFEEMKYIDAFLDSIDFYKLSDSMFISDYEQMNDLVNSICSVIDCLEENHRLHKSKILLFSQANELKFDHISSYYEIKNILEMYERISDNLIIIFPNFSSVFLKFYQHFSEALKTLEKYRIENYGVESYHELLPNAWYITPLGDLYNTLSKGGHGEANLKYPYFDVKEMFETVTSPIIPKDYNNYMTQKRKKIIQNGYIDHFDFMAYLNFIGHPAIIPTGENDKKKVPRIYEQRIVKVVLGIISAQAGFNQFTNHLLYDTNNPSESLNKVLEMTKEDFNDILVRCAGFHKIESNLKKTITTSSISNIEIFSEYLKRGWNVSIVPPIIIDKEYGMIKELDINSPIIAYYIENQLNHYNERYSQDGGKVYCKHLEYGKM